VLIDDPYSRNTAAPFSAGKPGHRPHKRIDTRRTMGAKTLTRAFPHTMPFSGILRSRLNRRPTEAERAYVRAKARQAARAIFEAELRRERTGSEDESPCE